MHLLIVSDIHGDYISLNKVLEKEKFDKLIVLGDLFSYDYNPNNENVMKLITEYKDKLILIKGNCDYQINYEKYNVSYNEVITLLLNNHNITLTHGYKYSKDFLPNNHGDIFISGHTHVPLLYKENIIYANPGSLGKPRLGYNKSYIIFNNNKIIIKDIYDNIIKEMKIN